LADKRCDNGHFIDESWDLCPYCPQEAAGELEIPIVRPRPVTAEVPRVTPGPPSPAPFSTTSSSPFAPLAAVPDPPSVRRERPPAPSFADSAPIERTIAVRGMVDPGAGAKRYVVGWLVGISGSTRGESYAVRMGRNVLGRDRRSDIVINDDQASSHHADLVFRPEERRNILMDHNSTNGTYVNEAEIEPRRDLAGNDVIRIGSHKFLFKPLCHEGFHWDDEGPLK
jgi:hypothetical protein